MKYLTSLLFLPCIVSAGEIVSSQMYCDDTKIIVQLLKEEYQEVPVIYGQTHDMAKSTMTIWINPKDETWTILSTKDDYSCIVGVGEKLNVVNYGRRKKI